jgi:hypothetical protein
MVGKSVFDLLSSPHRPLLRETIARALRGEVSVPMAWTYVHREGKSVHVLAKAFASEAADGQGEECLIVNTDITPIRLKLKKLEIDALESREKLKSLTEEHELLRKNIATFIRGKDNGGQK